MKEVKAYVRTHMLDKVIRGLEEAGFGDMTIDDLRAVRRGLRDEDIEYSVELADRYMNVAKLGLVVRDSDAGRVTRIICERARTGAKGDGLVYVSPVDEAIHIRTGSSGEEAVESTNKESDAHPSNGPDSLEVLVDNVFVAETSKPIDEACQALERAIADQGFGILHVHDVRRMLVSKGIQFDHEVRIYDVCNPRRAKQVLEQNPLMSAALPCAISIFSEGGRTKLAVIRPTVMLGLFGSAELGSVAEEVERTVVDIVRAAAAESSTKS